MVKIVAEKNGKIVERINKQISQIPYAACFKLLRNKDVKVNGVRIKDNVEVKQGDVIEVYYSVNNLKRYETIFIDQNILIINKFKKISSEDLFESVKQDYSQARFIHRLDTNTSGLMVFALNSDSEKELLAAFKNRSVEKYYIAEVFGKMPKITDVLTAFLQKNEKLSQVFIFDTQITGCEKILTEYKVLEEKDNSSLLEIKLLTGKTHQIRAHLAHIGHFVIGDGKYGKEEINKLFKAKSQRLAAVKITFCFKGGVLKYLDGKSFSIPCRF